MNIRKPNREDLPALSKLWQEAFGDSPEEVAHFYKTAFSFDRALLAQAQNPVACIYWMDAKIAGQRIAYLYAFAVEEACRGKGVGKALLEKTLETLKEKEYAAAVLVPGEESLQAYYEKCGFSVFGNAYGAEAKAPGLPGSAVSPETYLARRAALNPDLQWQEEAFTYLAGFCKFYVGEGWVLTLGQDGVQEYVGDPQLLPHILLAVAPGLTAKPPVAMAYCFAPIELPKKFGPMF